jgi:hypothetical protein
MAGAPSPRDMVTAAVAAKRFNVSHSQLHHWVSRGRLRAIRVPGHGPGGMVRLVHPDAVAPLAKEYHEKAWKRKACQPRAGRLKEKRRTIEGGREVFLNDPIADVSRAEGYSLTAADREELARRRERFEQRRLSWSSR